MVNGRRFPPPWSADKIPGGYVVRESPTGPSLFGALPARVHALVKIGFATNVW
jgi:hypothetical protein